MADDLQRSLAQIQRDVVRLMEWHKDKGRGENGDYDHTPIAMIRLLIKGHLASRVYDSIGSQGLSDPTPAEAARTAPWHLPYHAEAEYKENIRKAEQHLSAAMEVALKTRPIDATTDALHDDECCRQHLEWFGKKVLRGKKRGDLCYLCWDHRPLTYEQLAYYETHGKWPGQRFDPKARKAV